MLARHFLIGVMALTALPHTPGQLGPPIVRRPLLQIAQLSDDVGALLVGKQDAASGLAPLIFVRLDGLPSGSDEKNAKPFWGMSIQVWLLRVDGTALQPEGKWNIGSLGTESTEFQFALIPAKELAGVVVSLNGKLYVREIKVNPAA